MKLEVAAPPAAAVVVRSVERVPAHAGVIVGAFIASGAAGLIYQVVWSRDLVLVFGNSTQAVATIVTAFMAGLGLGGLAGGRLAARLRRPLAAYGLVEVGVAVLAMLLPATFDSLALVYRSAFLALSPQALALVRLLLALAAVTPATFLMGMTLPLLVAHAVRRLADAGPRLGELYAANTLGGMVGCALGGFALIELLGLAGAAHVAVGLNLLAAGIALSQRREDGLGPVAERAEPASRKAAAGHRAVYAATVVSGFGALALEVLWTRLLAEGTGSSIYVFTFILTLFLLGIAAGSLWYKRRSAVSPGGLRTLGLALGVTGAVALLSVITGSGALSMVPRNLTFLLPLGATVAMGYSFPLSARLVTPSAERAGPSTGRLYALNTMGSIAGSAGAAFLLIPLFGTVPSIIGIAALQLLAGALLVLAERPAPRLRVAAPAMAGLALAGLLASATGLPVARTPTANTLLSRHLLAAHAEDSIATIDTVGGAANQKRLYVNGTSMTALTVDTKLMAYIPKAARADAEDMLVICFGMGSTYRSGLRLGMNVDAVELSPSVPKQMPTFYPDAASYLENPRGHVIIADGRNYVRLSDRRYDLIAVDPPPPIESAGTVVLYTQEFLRQAAARLQPGGVLLLWIPFMEPLDGFKDHVRTFRSVFPETTAVIGRSGVFLMGSERPITLDPDTVAHLLGSPGARDDFASAADDPGLDGPGWAAELSRQTWATDGQLDAFAGPGPLITDDRPRTEYFLLRWLLAHDVRNFDEASLRAALV